MASPNWEDVAVPRGAFISWGEQPGQHVTGKVLDYHPTNGTDFAGNPCPQLSVELLEPAASINKQGERTDFPTGDFVVLNAGLANLKRGVIAAQVSRGDLVKITFDHTEPLPGGKAVKVFTVKVARGAGQAQQPSTQQTSAGLGAAPSAQPPF